MHSSQLFYPPVAFPFFAIFAGILVVLFILLQLGLLRYAYMRIGLGRTAAMLVLLGSLLGSYVNIEVAQLPEERLVLSGEEVDFFGMRYVVPIVVDWPGTVIAVNVGGAVIPGVLSLYLLVRNRIWVAGTIATAVVAVVVHQLARPIHGVGIAVPIIAPPLVASEPRPSSIAKMSFLKPAPAEEAVTEAAAAGNPSCRSHR